MMANWYKQALTRRKGIKFSYRPVYGGNLGRDGTSSKKDPQFAQPLDETDRFSDLSSLKFSDVLREMGCKAVHIDSQSQRRN